MTVLADSMDMGLKVEKVEGKKPRKDFHIYVAGLKFRNMFNTYSAPAYYI